MGLGDQGGGLASETDVRGAGEYDWAQTSAMSPMNPLVGGPNVDGLGIYDVDRMGSRVVTTPLGNSGPAGDGVMATPDAPGVELFDSWRDLFNLKGSPMPWLLLGSLIVLGLMQFRIQARSSIGPARVDAAVG